MLHLCFDSLSRLREREEFIPYPDDFFDSVWEPEWVNDTFSRAIVHDLDLINMMDCVIAKMACAMSWIADCGFAYGNKKPATLQILYGLESHDDNGQKMLQIPDGYCGRTRFFYGGTVTNFLFLTII